MERVLNKEFPESTTKQIIDALTPAIKTAAEKNTWKHPVLPHGKWIKLKKEGFLELIFLNRFE